MAYYTGSVNNYSDLLSALTSACVAEGWAWDGTILSKGSAFVRPYVSASATTTEGPGLIVEGGTGSSGGVLSGASAARPRLGRPGSAGEWAALVWPATYHVMVHANPDEVYLVLSFGVDYHYWLSFGLSDQSELPGSGLWLSASSRRGYGTDPSGGATICATNGGVAHSSVSAYGSTAFFWETDSSQGATHWPHTLHTGLDSGSWFGGVQGASVGALNAIYPAAPHIGQSPNVWNNEAILIPIKIHQWRASSKCSLVCQVRHARYVRVNNYEPGQIITLGPDRWIIFPFYRKNSAVPAGGIALDHSGTFGWAIRYDGP